MYYPGCEVYEETREPEAKKAVSFHDWMKNMSAKERDEIDRLACEAEDARERAEELEWEDYSEDRTGWEYEFYAEFDE